MFVLPASQDGWPDAPSHEWDRVVLLGRTVNCCFWQEVRAGYVVSRSAISAAFQFWAIRLGRDSNHDPWGWGWVTSVNSGLLEPAQGGSGHSPECPTGQAARLKHTTLGWNVLRSRWPWSESGGSGIPFSLSLPPPCQLHAPTPSLLA